MIYISNILHNIFYICYTYVYIYTYIYISIYIFYIPNILHILYISYTYVCICMHGINIILNGNHGFR